MSVILKLNDYKTESEYTWAWCTDCDQRWEGQERSKVIDKGRFHAKQTGHHVVIRSEIMIEYNYVE